MLECLFKYARLYKSDVYGRPSPSAAHRLKMKPDVVLRRLAIAVASNDHSYMPQLVSVSVGRNRRSLQEIRDIRIPSNVTGFVALLDNANITHPCKSPAVSPST